MRMWKQMIINKYHGSYNVSRRAGAYSYIVVHYVGAGTSAPGSAKNNCIYFSGGNRNASAHYFIDDGGIWEYADPDQYYTWHCGDGGGKYGIKNSNSIGIEVCMNGDNPFTSTEIKFLTELVAYLRNKYGISANNVVRHYDASRKMCPYYYAQRTSEWNKLKSTITSGAYSDPTTPSTPSSSALAVDGFWGINTTRKLQKVLGTPQDGIVSGQTSANFRLINHGGLQYSSWETGRGGSQCIAALQRKIGASQDGYFGVESTKALQRYLGTSVDGVVSNPSAMVMALQRRLNAGSI